MDSNGWLKKKDPYTSPYEEQPKKEAEPSRCIGCGIGSSGGNSVPLAEQTCYYDRGDGISILPGGMRTNVKLAHILRN